MDTSSVVGGLHPALIHYPIAFLTYGLGCDLYTFVTGRRTAPFAEWTLALGVLGCIPSIATGWFAASDLVGLTEVNDATVRMHNITAYGVFFAAVIYTGMRFGELHGEWRTPKLFKMVMAALLVIGLVSAGLTGGKVTRQSAAMAAQPEPTNLDTTDPPQPSGNANVD